jgi:FKBP-type peptidyl-prolyl cis-trans isomerase FklB
MESYDGGERQRKPTTIGHADYQEPHISQHSGFADRRNRWDNISMTKQTLAVTGILAASLTFSGVSRAQDTPPATPAPKAAAPKPAAGQTGAAAAKPGATAGTAGTTAKKPGTTTGATPSAGGPLTTTKQKASYAIGQKIGTDVGKGLQRDGVEIDAAALARGLRDAISNAKPAITPEEQQAALTLLEKDVRAKIEAKMAIAGAANKKEGDAFLAGNKTKPGVVTLPSGLQYKIIKEGNGPKPTAADSVTCNYAGTLISGKEFDSSYKRGEPVTFQVGEVIKGWGEALQLMPVGSKWQLFVPPDLAYEGQQKGPDIGPNSTLLFEVELISIAPKTDPAKKDPAK